MMIFLCEIYVYPTIWDMDGQSTWLLFNTCIIRIPPWNLFFYHVTLVWPSQQQTSTSSRQEGRARSGNAVLHHLHETKSLFRPISNCQYKYSWQEGRFFDYVGQLNTCLDEGRWNLVGSYGSFVCHLLLLVAKFPLTHRQSFTHPHSSRSTHTMPCPNIISEYIALKWIQNRMDVKVQSQCYLMPCESAVFNNIGIAHSWHHWFLGAVEWRNRLLHTAARHPFLFPIGSDLHGIYNLLCFFIS